MADETEGQQDTRSLDELVDELRETFLQQIRVNERRVRPTPEQERLIAQLKALHPARWHRLNVTLKDASAHAQWSRTETAQWNFNYLNAAASGFRTEATRARRVVHLDSNERSQQNHDRQRRNEVLIPAPEIMMDDDDPMVRIAGLLLFFRKGRLWFDDFHKAIRLDWKGGSQADRVDPFPLDDPTVLRIMIWAKIQDPELAKVGKQVFVDAIELVADLDHRNEVRQWLEGLVWDKTERAARLAPDYWHTEDTDYTRAVSLNLLVGLVARVFEPGCQYDHMVVLVGGQGLYKSQSLRALGGQWYRSLQAGIDSNDFVRLLHSAWLAELPELSSMTSNRTHAEQTKARLSTQVDSLVPKYKNFAIEMKRSSVPVGTTNDEHFHYDPTSDDARRYLPLFVSINGSMIDLEKIKADREQLFAEAVERYRTGYKFWEVPRDAQREAVAKVRRVNEFSDSVSTWIERWEADGRLSDCKTTTCPCTAPNMGTQPNDQGTVLTIRRLALALGLTTAQMTQNNNHHRIGQALTQLGYVKGQRRITGGKAIMIWLKDWNGLTQPMGMAERVDGQELGSDENEGGNGRMPF